MKEKLRDYTKKYFSIPESRRVIYDYIRTLACIGIICLHATGDRTDPIGIYFETTSRIALPMFVLLSGLLILGSSKFENYPAFYGRRFVKIVVPYLVYGVIYIGWVHAGHSIPSAITADKLIYTIKSIPSSIALNMIEPRYFHLWFMMMIMGFYIVAPFVQRGLHALTDYDLKWLFVIMLAVYAIKDYMPVFLFGYELGFNNFFPNWMIYFLAGYILSRFDTKKTYTLFSVLGVLSAVAMFLWKYRHPDVTIGNFYDLAPHMMLATCGFYSITMLLEPYITKCKWLNWVMMKVSQYTFSIYMIHGIILINYTGDHPDYALTVKGTITEVLVVFVRCLIFVVIFDNLVTLNVQRLVRLIWKYMHKLWTILKAKTHSTSSV